MGPFVVVENAGTDTESVVFEDVGVYENYNYIDRNYSKEEADSLRVDIMRRLPCGTLTTEF